MEASREAERLYGGPVIDAHHHFWDGNPTTHPWLGPAGAIPFRYGDYSALRRTYLATDYRADAAGHRVVGTVLMEGEWRADDPLGETRFVEALAVESGLPTAMVGQVWLDRADVAEVIAAQARCVRVRGLRHKPGGPAHPDEVGRCRTLMSDERWRCGFALLEAHGLVFDLQTAWWNLHEAVVLARDFPRTIIVLDHAGLPGDRAEATLRAWHAAMSALADCANVRVKISGLGIRGQPWRMEDNRRVVLETIALFGPARCMFASNFPVDGLCGTFDTIYTGFKQIVAHLPDAEQGDLFFGTARRTYLRAGDDVSSPGPDHGDRETK